MRQLIYRSAFQPRLCRSVSYRIVLYLHTCRRWRDNTRASTAQEHRRRHVRRQKWRASSPARCDLNLWFGSCSAAWSESAASHTETTLRRTKRLSWLLRSSRS